MEDGARAPTHMLAFLIEALAEGYTGINGQREPACFLSYSIKRLQCSELSG